MTENEVQGGMAGTPSPPFQLVTLKKRAEFKAAANGARFSTPAFTLLRRPDGDVGAPVAGLRFGFTVTKKIGNAVVRNRIRRRLREAVRVAAPRFGGLGMDLVALARRAAIERSFADLVADMARAIETLARRETRKRDRSRAGDPSEN